MEGHEALDAITQQPVVVGEQLHKLGEALLLPQDVHGQDEPVTPHLPATHVGVVENGVEVIQNQGELEGRAIHVQSDVTCVIIHVHRHGLINTIVHVYYNYVIITIAVDLKKKRLDNGSDLTANIPVASRLNLSKKKGRKVTYSVDFVGVLDVEVSCQLLDDHLHHSLLLNTQQHLLLLTHRAT